MILLKLLGLSIPVVFTLSYVALFLINPQTIEGVDFYGITSFNLVGFEQQLFVALVNYTLVGILISFFGFRLSLFFEGYNISRYGSYLIIISGFSWASLGIFPIDVLNAEKIFGIPHMIRIVVCWLSGVIGLILISSNINEVFQPSSLKCLSLVISILMLTESICFSFFGYSGIMSMILWFVYMLWFGYLGLYIRR